MKKAEDIWSWYHIVFHLIWGDKIKWGGKKCLYTDYVAYKDSPVHYMLAFEIIKPILRKYAGQFVLWRFHRAFLKEYDSTLKLGPLHSFKFKFKTNLATYRKIEEEVRNHAVLKKLRKEGILRRLEIGKSKHSISVGADHDTNWPYELKSVWSFYVHGTSVAWLRLVTMFYEQVCKERFYDYPEKLSFLDKLILYGEVRERISEIWTAWANHAFFHHASGIFGYPSTMVRWKKTDTELVTKGVYGDGNRIIEGRIVF